MKIHLLALLLLLPLCLFAQWNKPETLVEYSMCGPMHSRAADLNGDGYMDIIAKVNFRLMWFPNDGSHHFSSPVFIKKMSAGTRFLLADVDMDGDIDILSNSYQHYNKAQLIWCLNDGQGNFNTQKLLASNIKGQVTHIGTADLDTDGDADVLAYLEEKNELVWYANHGAAKFSLAIHIGDSLASYTNTIKTADIDRDGDLDILCARFTKGKLFWYENTGGGIFSKEHIIDADNYLSWPKLEDLNNDSHLDIIGVNDKQLVWYENNGKGSFLSPIAIYTFDDYSSDIHIADLNGDRHKDILLGVKGKTLALTNDGTCTYWGESVINLNPAYLQSPFPADINEDAKMDVLVTDFTAGRLLWCENQGRAKFKEFVIADETARINKSIRSICIADFDNNRELDIAALGQGTLEIYLNDGTKISRKQTLKSPNHREIKAFTADLDGDDDIDILFNGYVFKTYQNDGKAKLNPWKAYEHYSSKYLVLADLDNDHDIDIINPKMHSIELIKNDGTGDFSSRKIILEEIQRIKQIILHDLNLDDKKDIIFTSSDERALGWAKNRGKGKFSKPKWIDYFSDSKNFFESILVADINQDNYPDIIVNSKEDKAIYWYESSKDGFFRSIEVLVEHGLYDAPQVLLLDVDNDDDLDVVLKVKETILWYEQVEKLQFSKEKTLYKHLRGKMYPIDFDDDEDEDIILADYWRITLLKNAN